VRIHLFLIPLVSFSLFSSTIFAQVIYSWTDESGSAKFSDKVPVNVDPADLKKIKVRTNSSFKTVKQIAKEQDKTVSQQQQDLVKMSQRNCDIANNNLKMLNSFANITQADSNGNEITLTPEQKAQQLDLTRKQAEIYCTK